MQTVHHFNTASAALRACDDGRITSGSVLVIDRECIVAIADAVPWAVTRTSGPFRSFAGTTRSANIAESGRSGSQIRFAVDEAYRQGFPVRDELAEFGSLRSEMSACAREFRLTSDEILAVIEACDKRRDDFAVQIADEPARSPAIAILKAARKHLGNARRKLLSRPL